MSNILKGILNEVSPHNYDSDWDYQDAVARSGKSRSSYRSREDDTSDADIAYSKKMYQLSQKQKRDADHGRLASGTNEGTGLDIDRSIPGRTIARISGTSPDPEIGKLRRNPHAKKLPDFYDDNDYDQWSGKVGPSIHDDEEDTFHTDYTGDEEGELKEISNEKLAKYKTAAALDAGKADKEGDYKRGDKRFSGIVKATKKQFANDTKKSNISQGMAEADEKPAEPFKTGYPRVNNPKILGTQNRAKSIYHPPSKPNVKKLDKPLPENLGNELKSKSLEALQQVKQQLEQQRMADLEQWEKDFKQNTVSKFTAREPNLRQRATSTSMVAMPGEKHSELKTRLIQLNKAIEKQGILDNLVQKLDKKGLLTPNIQAGIDTSMLVRDGARDNYVELNKKLDKALEYVKNRLLTNKAAYAKPKAIDEDELDEACWKGYHKEGNKKMFGKTYPNCVKNTNEEQLDEKCWDTHKQVGMKNKGGKQVPNCVPKESMAEGSEEITWIKPNFDYEWDEIEFQAKQPQVPADVRNYMAKHFPDKQAWMKSVQYGRPVVVRPDHGQKIRNYTDNKRDLLNALSPASHDPQGPAKAKRVNALFDKGGPIEMPIILQTEEGLWLIGGKTRLGTANLLKGIPAKVWMIGGEQGVAEVQHSCPHCGGEMVSEELMNEKKDACYYKVKSRYKVWPSAYASGALVKCRNKGASNWGNGGKKNESSILEGINRADESLHDWFNKEKWVRMDTKGKIKGPCAREPGEGKPKCLPQSKAHSLGKKGRASAAQRKRREDPNPERSGKAINVDTKKNKG
jgi:hypothetical protein